ncbi:MAG: NAD(P)/FAD-dependent oxidoreductase [Alcaligenaceae bacterium]|nr:NAD(P)/FAD-dependent oxidoreductase [Alcaligenaceae bacterium]
MTTEQLGMNNSIDDKLDILLIGAGFTGLYQLYHFRKQGYRVHLIDAGSDVGGVWHWNCYPGARVDTHFQIYQYSMPELWEKFDWKERFPNWAQVREYFYFVDKELELSKDITFNSRVQSARWDEKNREWTVYCVGHQPIRARFVIANLGFGAKPHLPAIEGIDTFKGAAHHTGLWPQQGLDMEGKRVAVIGTGSSGVQVAQEAALNAKQVTVFQRSPNYALPMHQQQLSPEDNRRLRKDMPKAFEARGKCFGGFDFDFIPKNAVELSKEERDEGYEALWNAGGFLFWLGNYQDTIFSEESNHYAYQFWRDKVHARVKDPAVAEKLAPAKAPYPFATKRPSLEQWYYEIFNQNNVKLVDMNETPILRLTEKGIETAEGEMEFDIIAFATGFDAVTGGITSIDFRSTENKTFKEVWADGIRTQLGIATAGFPNLLFGYGPQSPAGFCNGPSSAEYQGDLLVELMNYLRDNNITRIEAQPEAQEEWRKLIANFWETTLFPRAKSWYAGANIPGKKVESLNFPLGLPTYISKFKESANQGYTDFALSK